MAHISVSNHFKRQEKALSDKILALRGFISSPLAMFLKENLKNKEKIKRKGNYVASVEDQSMQLSSKQGLGLE